MVSQKKQSFFVKHQDFGGSIRVFEHEEREGKVVEKREKEGGRKEREEDGERE